MYIQANAGEIVLQVLAVAALITTGFVLALARRHRDRHIIPVVRVIRTDEDQILIRRRH